MKKWKNLEKFSLIKTYNQLKHIKNTTDIIYYG